MVNDFPSDDHIVHIVGIVYITIGIVGFLCNAATLLMIATYRIYRLSAYTIMANLALADAIMLVVAGFVCGMNILQLPSRETTIRLPQKYLSITQSTIPYNEQISTFESLSSTNLFQSTTFGNNTNNEQFQTISPKILNDERNGILNRSAFSIYLLSFFEIAAWTAGMISYAFLGINRCVAICFYRTRARTLNRVSFAFTASTVTWIIGISTGTPYLNMKFIN